jgi:hypothetical protein
MRLQLRGYLSRLRKTAGFTFREHPFSIDADIEDAAGTSLALTPSALVQLVRQAGGFSAEVLRPAITNYYFHYTPPNIKNY